MSPDQDVKLAKITSAILLAVACKNILHAKNISMKVTPQFRSLF
jgi:hypothetical protein